MTLRRIFLSVLAAGLVVMGAESKDERTAVQRAVTDYLDALYEAKPELIERSVHPNLSKHGFYRNKEGVYQKGVMTYTQLHTLAGKWNAGNNKRDLSKAPREAVVMDVMSNIATAKVVADWGIDYMQLVKVEDGAWKIVNIVWESHPPKK